MDEYEQLAREAEARSEWEKLDGVNGNYLITSKGVIMCNDDNIQFILDAIRLLPQLVRELQEAKAQNSRLVSTAFVGAIAAAMGVVREDGTLDVEALVMRVGEAEMRVTELETELSGLHEAEYESRINRGY